MTVELDAHARGREWLQASVEVTRSLLAATGEEPLAAVARAVHQVAGADLTLVVLPALCGENLLVEAGVGAGTEDLVGRVFDAEEFRAGPLMMVPLRGDRDARGTLAIARRRGGQPFDEEDLQLATAFANHAAIALELAEARAYQQQMLRLEDRHRIAAGLHDHVLQRLFASGMSMQAMAAAVGAPYADRLEQLIADTDETIGQIRAVIQDLNDRGPGLLFEP